MSEKIDVAIDNPTPTLKAHLYTEITSQDISALVTITDPEATLPIDKLDVIAAFKIDEFHLILQNNGIAHEREKQEEDFPLMFNPPFSREWVQAGFLPRLVLDEALINNGYIATDSKMETIEDVSTLAAHPVSIRHADPREERPF